MVAVVGPSREEALERGLRDPMRLVLRRPLEEMLEVALALLGPEPTVMSLVEMLEARCTPIDATDAGHRLDRVLVPGPPGARRHLEDEARRRVRRMVARDVAFETLHDEERLSEHLRCRTPPRAPWEPGRSSARRAASWTGTAARGGRSPGRACASAAGFGGRAGRAPSSSSQRAFNRKVSFEKPLDCGITRSLISTRSTSRRAASHRSRTAAIFSGSRWPTTGMSCLPRATD